MVTQTTSGGLPGLGTINYGAPATPAGAGLPGLNTINYSAPSNSTPNPAPTTPTNLPLVNPNKDMGALNPGGLPGLNTINYGVPPVPPAPTPAQQTAQKYQSALSTVQEKNTPAPASSGDASSQIKDITDKTNTQQQSDQAGIDAAKAITEKMNQDPGFQQLMQDQKDYLSSQNQTQTLQDQYTQLTTQAGIPALNTQLINMKSVMDGTEQDIRNEITKAGGFATDSQVLALTTARNKTMIQNYNNLLQTRDDLVNQINTTMGFAKEDRANATALAKEKMDYDQQLISYEQKMQDNAKSAYQKIVDTPGYGYKALYDSTGGDAHTISLIENSLGLSQGSLKTLADKNSQTWSDAYKLGGDYVQKNNLTGEIRTAVNMPAGSSAPTSGTTGSDSVTIPGDPTSQSILSHTGLSIAAFGYLTQGTSALTRMSAAQRLQYMNEAQKWANDNNVDLATFQSQYEAYNKALQSNISRVNNVKVAEGELNGTLTNLSSAADDASFKSIKWENVAKLFAGQQFNDANVSKYAFHLNQLRSELALYNASASGKSTADDSDRAEAERIIKDGFAKGSITGFQSALKASVEKMDNTLQQNVERTNGQVWSLFGVSKPTVSLGTKVDTQRVNDLLNSQGIDYNDLVAKMSAPGALPEGYYPAVDATTGKPMGATKDEIKSGKFLAI